MVVRVGLVGLIVLATVLAGCLETSNGEDPGSSPGPAGPATADRDPMADQDPVPFMDSNESYPRKTFWDECTGFISIFYWPLDAEHAEQAPGWRPSPGQGVATGLDLYGLECQRVSWGPFERGPVRLLLEMHNFQDTPEGCWRYNVTLDFETMNSLWVDDPEIASFLKDVYGMPVYYSPIEFETTDYTVPGWSQHSWSWGLDGEPESWIQITDDGQRDSGTFRYRIFWYNDTAVSHMDWDIIQSQPTLVPHTSHGHMEPPMLAAEWPTEYAAGAAPLSDTQATGEITMYQDLLCEEPVERS